MPLTVAERWRVSVAIDCALDRLEALGSPGLVTIRRGRWRTSVSGWPLALTVGPVGEVYLLSTGRLLVAGNQMKASALSADDRMELFRLLSWLSPANVKTPEGQYCCNSMY